MSTTTSVPFHAPDAPQSIPNREDAPEITEGRRDARDANPGTAKPSHAASRQPSYRRHKASGQAVVTIDGKDIYLGTYDTVASRNAYDRLIGEWLANGRRLPTVESVTVAKIIERYWQHAQMYYRRADGTQTNEVSQIRYALRPLNHLYGTMLAANFGPLALKAVRELMIRGYDHPKFGLQGKLCRTNINKQVKRICRMMKWAVEQEFVASPVLTALRAVAPLMRGRSEARESPGVKPVARAVVEDTLPILFPTMRDMVMLQLETAMRPGEMVTMRACDIDMTDKTWLYRPPQHKTLHRDDERIIAIGPKAMQIVRRYLTADTQAPLFSPRKLMEERAALKRAERKTPVQPSQQNRKKKNPKKTPSDTYTTLSYGRALANAIKRHNRGKSEGEQIPHWHPHQLRHLRALELKRQFGLDVARAVLGHKQPCMTEMYAGVDTATAAEVMGKVG